MPDLTPEQKIDQVWQGIYGVPGTDERGMAGDVKEIKTYIKAINGKVQKYAVMLRAIIVVGSTVILTILGWLAKITWG